MTSSFAMWIQYSWGSFTKIQRPAATSSQALAETRDGSYRSRTSSYAMKKYSNVFGKMTRSTRESDSSKSTTPTRR